MTQPIIIDSPEGPVEFPAGTPIEAIEKAMRERFPPKAEHSTFDVVQKSVGKGTKELLNLPGTILSAVAPTTSPGDVDTMMRGVGDALAGKKMSYEDILKNYPSRPDTRMKEGIRSTFDVGKTFDMAGIPHTPPPGKELTPLQRIIGKAAEVVGGAVPLGAGISAATRTALAPQMKTAGLMAAGTGVGEEVGGPIGGLAGGLALPLAGPGAAELIRRLGRGSDPLNLQRAILDAERAGTTVSVGQGTESKVRSAIESTTGRFGGIGVVQKKGEGQAAQMGQRAEETAATLAPKMEDAVAGQRLIDRLTGPGGYVERFKSMADRLFKKVNHTGTVQLNETTKLLDDATGAVVGAEATSGSLVNPALKQFYANLIKDAAKAQGINLTPKQIEAFMANPAARPGGVLGSADLPFDVVKGLRSMLGRKIGSPGLADDIPKGELKRLYAAISADVEASLASNPKALAAWQRGNTFYRQGIDKIEKTISPLVEAGAPERVMTILEQNARKGGTELRRLMTSLKPDERNIVSAHFIRDMGKATASNQVGQGATETFSPAIFLQRYGKLKESGADRVLFDGSNMSDVRRALDGLLETSKRVQKGSRVLANPSGTAAAQFNLYQWFGVGGTGGVASVMTGNLLPAAATIGSMTVSNGLARMMTSPQFVRWLARSTKMAPGMWAQQGQRLAAESNDPDVRAALDAILRGGTSPQSGTR